MCFDLGFLQYLDSIGGLLEFLIWSRNWLPTFDLFEASELISYSRGNRAYRHDNLQQSPPATSRLIRAFLVEFTIHYFDDTKVQILQYTQYLQKCWIYFKITYDKDEQNEEGGHKRVHNGALAVQIERPEKQILNFMRASECVYECVCARSCVIHCLFVYVYVCM